MTGAQLPGVFGHLQPVLEHYGYLAVGGFVLLEDFGVPLPGETNLIAAAIFAGSGHMNIAVVVVVAVIAAIIGDNIGFVIGHFGGRPLVHRFGRYIFLTPERLDQAEDYFNRHGGKLVTIARFIPVLRQLNGILSGIIGMHWASSWRSTPWAPSCGWASGPGWDTWPVNTSSRSTPRLSATSGTPSRPPR